VNAAAALQAALAQRIGDTGLRCFDAAPVRAPTPHAVVEAPLLRDWNAADCTGREGRVAVQVHDTGERPDRLWQLVDGVEAALATAGPELAHGWRLIAGQVGTVRMKRGEALRWTATVEMRVRLYRVQ
jgi:hypothetical protein